MSKYRKDILIALLCFCFIIVLNFLLPRMLPGNPIAYLTGFSEEDMTVKQIEYYREALHLSDSLSKQFLYYLKSLLDGSLGYSFKKEDTVRNLIFKRLGYTVEITLSGVFFTSLLALFMGLRAGTKKEEKLDKILTPATIVLNTIPTFLIGIILILFLSFRLKLFPYANLNSPGIQKGTFLYFRDRIHHLVLPVLTLVLAQFPSRYLLVRNLAADIADEKYILYARTRGLSNRAIRYHYILPNISSPFINMVGMSVGTALGGTLVIENLFSINGMGTLLSEAVYSLDYPLIQGILFVTTAFMTLSIIISDGLCLLLDPRQRKREK